MLWVLNVGPLGKCTATGGLYCRNSRLRGVRTRGVIDHDLCTVRGKFTGDGSAYPATRARYEGYALSKGGHKLVLLETVAGWPWIVCALPRYEAAIGATALVPQALAPDCRTLQFLRCRPMRRAVEPVLSKCDYRRPREVSLMTPDMDDVLLGGSIASIHALLDARRCTVVELTQWYLSRIEAFNHAGPKLNAVRLLSTHALEDARCADKALASGRKLGVLHGIPVLIKDNVFIAHEYPTPAGATALLGFVPRHTATVVKRLTAAGAIVLGKSNLTEFADYVADVMPAEFSSAGGVVRNPHGIAYGRGQGSSVGSASAVAAAFAPIAVGGETQNSIQTPASFSSVVGLKPSVGMVSRAGIIPLVPSQDAPGVITRCVEDAALLFDVIAGADAHDPVSVLMRRDDRSGIGLQDISHVRIGVPRRAMALRPEFSEILPLFDAALSRLARAGATLVDPVRPA